MRTGKLGWPLVPSKHFRGEETLACPKCRSTNILMTTRPGIGGTGPGGTWRMFDQGGNEILACNACRHTSDGMRHPDDLAVRKIKNHRGRR